MYIVEDVVRNVIETQKLDYSEANKKYMRRICDSLKEVWGEDLIITLLSSDVGFKKLVSVVIELWKDGKVKSIVNKMKNGKDVTNKEREKFDVLIKEALKYGRSEIEINKIEDEYRNKRDLKEEILLIQKDIKEKFCDNYDRYIDLLLEKEGLRNDTKEKILQTNIEIEKLINAKLHSIMIASLVAHQEEIEASEFLNQFHEINKLIF